jgi:hypothetical protein
MNGAACAGGEENPAGCPSGVGGGFGRARTDSHWREEPPYPAGESDTYS